MDLWVCGRTDTTDRSDLIIRCSTMICFTTPLTRVKKVCSLSHRQKRSSAYHVYSRRNSNLDDIFCHLSMCVLDKIGTSIYMTKYAAHKQTYYLEMRSHFKFFPVVRHANYTLTMRYDQAACGLPWNCTMHCIPA